MKSLEPTIAAILGGKRLPLAKLLTQIENDTTDGRAGLNALFPYTGQAHLIGITGAPGTGKSSLVNKLALHFRSLERAKDNEERNGLRVGIVAIDPSSPFTGGAILGDRIRMRELAGDPGIFIRSMASRGLLGGLARMTAGVVQALDAAGFDIIMIETVGAGQAEVDIARLAHTTIVIEAPGLGDDIQAIKAGILEIADILVINKADRPGVELTERALRSMLQLGHPVQREYQHHGQIEIVDVVDKKVESRPIWIPPIQRTIATEGDGIEQLSSIIFKHHNYLKEFGELHLRECERLKSEFDNLLQNTLVSRWRSRISDEQYQHVLKNIVDRKISPWQGVEELLGGGEK
jgi:LAO/AO transport system kinase